MEKKSFSVTCTKDKVDICEKSKAVQVSVGIELDIVKWMIMKLKCLGEVEPTQGHVGSRRKDMDVIMSIKKNKGGFFISLVL